MLPSPLQSILGTPLHSPWAVPLGCVVGAAVGGAVSVAFRGCSNLVTDVLLGGWLGIGGTNVQRYLDTVRTTARLQPHERALVDYPAVQKRLADVGTTVDDVDALKSLSDQLEIQFGRMVTQFNDYCRSRAVPPNPLMAGVIRHFYLTHCGERGIMLLSRRNQTACYLVAARAAQSSRIADALNQEGVLAGTVLRRLRCPYLRVDLANEHLRGARAFITRELDGEMQVHPKETPFEIGPLVEITHRRSTGSSGPSRASASPPLVEEAAIRCRHRVSVIRGPRLRKRLAELALPADSRTWRELNKIEADLAAQRPCGHPVSHKGKDYMSCDIHLGGWAAGRNRWRLLYRRIPDGFLLEDIDDTHGPRP